MTIGDVADRGRRLDRHRVEGDQRPLRRRPRHVQPGEGRDRRARLRVEPGRPQPAQPADQRHRHPRRRHRAVQRRAAQGRRGGDPRQRLRADRLLRAAATARSTPAGSGATSPGSAARSPTGSSSSPRRWTTSATPVRSSPSTPTPARPSLPSVHCGQPRRRDHGHASTSSASATAASGSSPADPTWSRRGCASRASATPWPAAGIPLDPDLIRVGEYELEASEEPARQLLDARRPADRDLRRQRPVRHQDDARCPIPRTRRARTTCR